MDEEPDYGFNDHAIGLLVYKNNSVTWWHSKAENYRDALGRAWDAMSAAGYPPDGKMDLAEAIAAALTTARTNAIEEELLHQFDNIIYAVGSGDAGPEWWDILKRVRARLVPDAIGASVSWQPIETASTDLGSMRDILVWNGERVTPAWYSQDEPGWHDSMVADHADTLLDPQPTHWTPFPTPPLAGGKE